MNTEQRFLAALRVLAQRVRHIMRIAPNAESAEHVLVNEPVIDSQTLRERDRHERTVLAGKLPKTLLGRGPRR